MRAYHKPKPGELDRGRLVQSAGVFKLYRDATIHGVTRAGRDFVTHGWVLDHGDGYTTFWDGKNAENQARQMMAAVVNALLHK